MTLDLTGKNALVCGSSKGIGKAIATQLAKQGANVTLMARSADALEKVVDTLDISMGQKHGFAVADFSKPDSLRVAIHDLLQYTSYHILINNTGGPPAGPISKATPEQFVSAYTMHLICNHTLATALLPGMKEAEYGRIINVISTSVKQPLDGLGVSNTTRGAVANWAKTLANEVGQYNITVNNVLPGATSTERLDEIIHNKANKLGKSYDEVAKTMQSAVPMKRFAKPEEVAAAACFLASPSASYINGINLPVDGGRTKSL